MKKFDRRTFVQGAGLLSVLACLPASALAQIISRTPPMSPFGADSTADVPGFCLPRGIEPCDGDVYCV